MATSTPPQTDQAQRPFVLVLVTTWDFVLASLAALAALAVFSGHRQVRGQTVDIPLAVQIFSALADAALATALVLIGALLTRRAAWVRRAQVIVLAMAIVLAAVSLAVALVTDESARDTATVLVSAVLILLDLLVVLAMSGPSIRARFNEPGEVPLYLGALIAFWAASSAAFFILGLRTG